MIVPFIGEGRMYPKTVEEFNALVTNIEATPDYIRPMAFATGIAIMCGQYPTFIQHITVNVGENFSTAAILAHITGYTRGNETLQLGEAEIREALHYFAPFENNGKADPNIQALTYIGNFLAAAPKATGFVSFATMLDGNKNAWYKAFNYAFCFRLAAQGVITLEPEVINDFSENLWNIGYLIK